MNRQKLPLIIGLIATPILVLAAIFIIPNLLAKPDYDSLIDSANTITSTVFPNNFYQLSDLTDGNLTEADHENALKDAQKITNDLKVYLDTIESANETLKQSQIKKTTSFEKYQTYQEKADAVIAKLKPGVDDLNLYIEFASRFYASNLRYLTTSDSKNLTKLATVSDAQVDQIFEPLTQASSEKLREIGDKLSSAVKQLTVFYSKYAEYISGEKQVTTDIYSEIVKDTETLETATEELNIDLDEKIIFNLSDEEIDDFENAAYELYTSLRDEAAI